MIFTRIFSKRVVKLNMIVYYVHIGEGLIFPGKADIIIPGTVLGILLVKTNKLKLWIQRKTPLDDIQVNRCIGFGFAYSDKPVSVKLPRYKQAAG